MASRTGGVTVAAQFKTHICLNIDQHVPGCACGERRWRVECDDYRWTYLTEKAANANRRLANVRCPCKGGHRIVELAYDGETWKAV